MQEETSLLNFVESHIIAVSAAIWTWPQDFLLLIYQNGYMATGFPVTRTDDMVATEGKTRFLTRCKASMGLA